MSESVMNGHGHDFGHEFVSKSMSEADSDTDTTIFGTLVSAHLWSTGEPVSGFSFPTSTPIAVLQRIFSVKQLNSSNIS